MFLGQRHALGRLAEEDYLGLLEIAAGVCVVGQRGSLGRWKRRHAFVYEDQAEVITCRILLVDFAEGRGQVEAAQEEADGYGLAARGRSVHDLGAKSASTGRTESRKVHTSNRTSVSLSLY